MMIRRAQLTEIMKAYKAQRQQRPSSVQEAARIQSSKDDLKLTFSKADVDNVIRLVKDLPEIRQDKVDEVKAKLREGGYKVEPEEVADSILRRLLADEIK